MTTVSLPPMPSRIAVLPRDERGYPVPWFVQWIDGKPVFPIMDGRKWPIAVRDKRCWICGQPLGPIMAFVIGPMCGINRTSAEPPSHLDCAKFAAMACPFLTKPRMKRLDCSEHNTHSPPGVALMRNPGCCGIWSTKSYSLIDAGNGRLIRIGEPTKVQWFAYGRPATFDEVRESIRTGLPTLQAMAKEEGPHSEALLVRMTTAFDKYLPKP